MSREKKAEIKAFHDDLHDIMDGAGTMKDTDIAEPSEYQCSVCGLVRTVKHKYCPNCGSKMKEV